MFAEKGFEATRTDEIAARAGVSKGTLYLYYPSKEVLLQAVIDSARMAALAGARLTVEHEGSRSDVLRGLLCELRVSLRTKALASILKLALSESRRFPELIEIWRRRVERPMHALIAGVVRQGMDRGEFREMDPSVAAHALLVPVLWPCLHLQVDLPGEPADRRQEEALVEQHVELVLRGLRR